MAHERLAAALVWFLGGVLAPLAVFLSLAFGLGEDEVTAFDRGALRAVEYLHAAAATSAMRGLTFFGDYLGATLLTVALVAVLFVLRRRRDALFVVAVMAGSGLLQFLTKLVFARPRPSVFPPLTVVSSFSYPSGHAMISASLALALTVVCWHSRWRWAAIAGGAVFTLAVSFTRLYLGVHYPSDLLAGWCLAVAWTVCVGLVFDLSGLAGAVVRPAPGISRCRPVLTSGLAAWGSPDPQVSPVWAPSTKR